MKGVLRMLFFVSAMVVTSQCDSDDAGGGSGSGTGTGGCATTANCGCSNKKKADCGGSCCKWVTNSGCKCR